MKNQRTQFLTQNMFFIQKSLNLFLKLKPQSLKYAANWLTFGGNVAFDVLTLTFILIQISANLANRIFSSHNICRRLRFGHPAVGFAQALYV